MSPALKKPPFAKAGETEMICPATCDTRLVLVRGAAVWALSRLLSPEDLAALRHADDDAEVAAEWDAALG